MGAWPSSDDGCKLECKFDGCCSAAVSETTALLRNGEANGIESPSAPSEPPYGAWHEPESVVQFTCSIYYCSQTDTEATIDVVRFGDASGIASFDFNTVDYTAKAGHKYEAVKGSYVFGIEQTSMSIQIPIIGEHTWDASLEFRVVLTRVTGAAMGKYLYESRVKILNEDFFPSNKFCSDLRRSQTCYFAVMEIDSWSLMREMFRMLLHSSEIWYATSRKMLMDQFYGVHFFITLYLQMYLVDVVLHPREEEESSEEEGRYLLAAIHGGAQALGRALREKGEEEEDSDSNIQEGILYDKLLLPHHRRETAMVIGFLYVLPVAVSHLFAILSCYLKIPGSPRELLQANLLHKFLYYTEDARHQVKNSEIIMALLRDTREVIDFGFMRMLKVVCMMGKLCWACIFIFAENKMAVIPLLVYPFVLTFWLRVRESITYEANEVKAEKHDDVCSAVNSAVSNYRLICDFQIRPMIVDDFYHHLALYHGYEADADMIIQNNLYAAPWLIAVTIAIYMGIGSGQVESVGGALSLGAFLATINVFKEVGAEIQQIYVECMQIQNSYSPLRKITKFMNMQTDLADRMRLERMRREEGRLHREEARKKFQSTLFGLPQPGGDRKTHFAVDDVAIEIHNLTFNYPFHPPLFRNVSMTFPQGSLTGIIGPSKEGKATFLRLLGQVILPAETMGSIFVPPHLRILHVSSDPCFLDLSLLKNIILGSTLQKVGGIQRVTKVCKALGFTDDWLKHLRDEEMDEDFDPHPAERWSGTLTHTDFSRLTLARAFVMNPEFLILHKPTMMFDDNQTDGIMYLLRLHVDERGVELPEGSHVARRPRTVFFSAATLTSIKYADTIYRMSRGIFTKVNEDDVNVKSLRHSALGHRGSVLRESWRNEVEETPAYESEQDPEKLQEILELVK